MNPNPKPSVGRIVNVVLSATIPGIRDSAVGEVRPAIITHIWPDGSGGVADYVNVQVFLDGDGDVDHAGQIVTLVGRSLHWLSSVPYNADGKTPRTWHWPGAQ